MNDNEALAAVRGILEKGWCKGKPHANAQGHTVPAFSPNRTASCILGAIELVSKTIEQEDRLYYRIGKVIGGGSALFGSLFPIAEFNDAPLTTLEDVLLVLKHAEELTDE